MKVTINIDCTPEEARTFLGLPDVQPMQTALMQQLQDQMAANMKAMDPETMMKTWLPVGLQGIEQFQKMMWSQMSSAMGGAPAKDGKK
ncbi:MAG: DUF6489 family protein [Niveispirillum sp.]|uniref:DUF6489 family protein n=1 Tax=Niveispirillum sp. TaxID=1917217 RepID=UPI003BA64954